MNREVSERDRALRIGHQLCQAVLNMTVEQKLAVDEQELENYFKYAHNELKGETGQSERDRWLRFLKNNHNILSVLNYEKRMYIFLKTR